MSKHTSDRSVRTKTRRWNTFCVLLLALGLMATTTADAGAQPPAETANAAAGTCADLGGSVVEPLSVSWESDSDPILDPQYLWAYGDVDRLWDDSFDAYWFHWYNAVPGSDPYVVYRFEPGTTIEGVQFTNDWSDGDLQFVGLDEDGEPVSGVTAIPLESPYTSYAAPLSSMSVAAVKMTTSTQQVKLIEVDFCGGTSVAPLDLEVSSPECETISASWTPQPGANHQVTISGASQDFTSSPSVVGGAYQATDVPEGTYEVTLTATADGSSASESATVAVSQCITNCDPADAYCDSINVIDSFGDAPLPQSAANQPQWDKITDYYALYGDRPNMCSMEVHNSYWTAVRDANGTLTYYPSWHPPIGPDGCLFTHEHGIDPRTSDLYDEDHPTNIGVPFGFVHPGGGGSGRIEDHPGHKVVVFNDLQLTTNNPFGAGTVLDLFEVDGQPVTCDWYSKLHQGTWSEDALGFNLHEYFLNYSCDDGTEIRIKEMTDFGWYSADAVDGPDFPINGGPGTVQGCGTWFATNFPGPDPDPDPSSESDFGDAGRSFTCLMNDAKIMELWKPSAHLRGPAGSGSIDYDPYYVSMNSNRYAIYEWWDYFEQGGHVGDDAMISMVDFCVEGSELREELLASSESNFVQNGWFFSDEFRVTAYCAEMDPSVLDQWAQDIDDAGGDTEELMLQRKFSAENVFNGTRRGVHTKGPRVWDTQPNFGSYAFFCSNHLGLNSQWPTNPATGSPVTTSDPWTSGDDTPVCYSGIPQLVSTENTGHVAVEGSTAGATQAGGNLIGNGPGNEIIIDMNELYPNNGVQAPN